MDIILRVVGSYRRVLSEGVVLDLRFRKIILVIMLNMEGIRILVGKLFRRLLE